MMFVNVKKMLIDSYKKEVRSESKQAVWFNLAFEHFASISVVYLTNRFQCCRESVQ